MITPLSATLANLRRLRDEAEAAKLDPQSTMTFYGRLNALDRLMIAAVNALPELLSAVDPLREAVEERDRLREALLSVQAATSWGECMDIANAALRTSESGRG